MILLQSQSIFPGCYAASTYEMQPLLESKVVNQLPSPHSGDGQCSVLIILKPVLESRFRMSLYFQPSFGHVSLLLRAHFSHDLAHMGNLSPNHISHICGDLSSMRVVDQKLARCAQYALRCRSYGSILHH